jgi:hypothetical protein
MRHSESNQRARRPVLAVSAAWTAIDSLLVGHPAILGGAYRLDVQCPRSIYEASADRVTAPAAPSPNCHASFRRPSSMPCSTVMMLVVLEEVDEMAERGDNVLLTRVQVGKEH